MRYTIPGKANDRARVVVRNRLMPRGEWWAIIRRGDLLNGLMGQDHLPPVHRERVRFGAWEERPRVSLSAAGRYQASFAAVTRAFRALVKAAMDVYLQNPAAVAAVERSLAQTGTGEGPSISGPENTYKCAHCGLDLRPFETAWIGDAPVCHPHEGRDCYRRVTVFGEILGSMKDREGL